MLRKLFAAALTLVLLLGAGWTMTRTGAAPAAGLPFAAAAQEAAAEAETPEIAEMALGAEDAPVTVIEYASFTCPHCANFHEGPFQQIKKNYVDTGKVRFIYREVYFDKFGMWASMIARCGGPEKFFGITDLIYKGQSDWARAGSEAEIANALRKIGRLAGLGEDQLEACLTDSDKLRALVAWYQKNAAEHGIDSTPSFVIGGKTYSNMSYEEFAQILDEQLGE